VSGRSGKSGNHLADSRGAVWSVTFTPFRFSEESHWTFWKTWSGGYASPWREEERS